MKAHVLLQKASKDCQSCFNEACLATFSDQAEFVLFLYDNLTKTDISPFFLLREIYRRLFDLQHTNPKCKVAVDVKNDRSAPTVNITFGKLCHEYCAQD